MTVAYQNNLEKQCNVGIVFVTFALKFSITHPYKFIVILYCWFSTCLSHYL
jgi:hypothetical protein